MLLVATSQIIEETWKIGHIAHWFRVKQTIQAKENASAKGVRWRVENDIVFLFLFGSSFHGLGSSQTSECLYLSAAIFEGKGTQAIGKLWKGRILSEPEAQQKGFVVYNTILCEEPVSLSLIMARCFLINVVYLYPWNSIYFKCKIRIYSCCT